MFPGPLLWVLSPPGCCPISIRVQAASQVRELRHKEVTSPALTTQPARVAGHLCPPVLSQGSWTAVHRGLGASMVE